MDDRELPFAAHIEELRQRLRRAVISILVFLTGTIAFREEIFRLLQVPMQQAVELLRRYHPESPAVELGMHFKDPIEPFFTYLKVAVVAALFLAIPFVLYQVWMFIAPGLYRHEKKATLPFIVSSTFMFLLGGAFCHQVVLPFGYYALLVYAGDSVEPMLMMKEYIGITLKLLLVFGLVFETPVFIVFLCRVGLVTPKQLARFRKQAVVVVAITAAILTPPDVVTQILLGVPLYLLYELSIVGAKLFGKPLPKEEDEDTGASEGDAAT